MKYFPTIVVILAFALGGFLYPNLPAQMASHWGASGEVNGYTGKFFGVFFMPAVLLVLLFVFWLLPKIDPKKENIEKFRRSFNSFVAVLFVFMFYVYSLTLFWNLGYRFNMSIWFLPAFAVLFYAIGDLIGKAEPNWSIGIRTPWTLSSEEVWRKTHLLGGKVYKWLAVFPIFAIFVPAKIGLIAIIALSILSAIFLVVYSYFVFKKLKINN